MSISIFTSCALNYLPKARSLAASLQRHAPGTRLTLCLCDAPPSWLDLAAEPFDRIWLPEDLGYDRAWIFEHTVMELCTAVKGRGLRRLQEDEPADLHAYLDPDVYLFHDLAPIEEMMHGASIGLVPHIIAPEATDVGVQVTEMSVTGHGIYNLGHLFVRPDQNGCAFANWWAERLDHYCFDDRQRGLFTDQRWVDLVPAIFDGVRILRQPGLDVASWNLSHRDIRQTGPDAFSINGKPLITYHFSGTGATGAHRRVRETFAPCNPATAEIERIYEDAIAREGQTEVGSTIPAFDLFDDGTLVTPKSRRLYRDNGDLRRAFPDPYADGPGVINYRTWLQEHRPGAVSGIRLCADRIAHAYDDLFDQNYYVARYPNVAAAIEAGEYRSAQDHYECIGSKLLMDPNEYFVSSYYLARAEEAGTPVVTNGDSDRENTLLWHYLETGLPSAAEPIEFFDSLWYLAQNPDLEAALRSGRIGSPLGHFLHYGSKEERKPGPGFAAESFLRSAPAARDIAASVDVRGAFGAFVRQGRVSGRERLEPSA